MLHEFALDPRVLNNWEAVRYFLDNFGISKGRLISRYPKKWEKMVYDSCYNCRDNEKKKIEERLSKIDSKLFKSKREFNSDKDWLTNAEQQHAISPFHAIISNKNPRNLKDLLIAEDINEDTPLWNVKKEDRFQRRAVDLARCVKPLLDISTEIIFVDPHFDPSKSRFRKTLSEFFKDINSNNKISRVEYHLGDKLEGKYFEDNCLEHIPKLLLKDRMITFVRWRKLEKRDMLHPRYILTDKGGIRIEVGLDEGNDGRTTDISILDVSLYEKRWKEYQRDTSPFDFVDELKIIGTL